MAISVTQTSVPRYAYSAQSGRVKLTGLPSSHVTLASSKARFVKLASSSPIEYRGNTMDGIPEIQVRQFQRVTLLAFVKTVEDVAITQSTVQSVHNSVFRPSVEGGEAVDEFFSTVSDVVFNTTQYDAKDQDGYNIAVEYEMATDVTSQGTSTYQLETVVELTTGEKIPLIGRVIVGPVFSRPINVW